MSDLDLSDADWQTQYIDGEYVPVGDRDTIAVDDPSTREQFTEVPAGTSDDVDAAYEAAADAQTEWANTPPQQRASVVRTARDLLKEHRDDILDLLAAESGTTRTKGFAEFYTSVGITGEAASFPTRMSGDRRESTVEGKENIVVREPQGVVGVISPWNFPLNLSIRAVAPAIATGNSVVLKPASNTPVTGGLLLAKLFEAAGLPEGVLNVVTGRGSDIGDAVAGHDEVDVVAFTGSTGVGRQVAATAAENLALPAMELGGNNVHVVTDDADLDKAIDGGVFGSFLHSGQICISINRHLVHEDVYDEYVERLTERAASLPTGSAHEPDTVVGPIIDESQRDQILDYVEETVDAGATLETGGGHDGLVVEPTVLSDATNDMAAACNEHFGPVAPVIPFSDDDEAVELANDTDYGLSGSVHAGDTGRARDIADRIDTGMIHINDQPINDEPHMPFGGTGDSGMGRYNGEAVMEEFTQQKWISVQREERDYPF
ncbi:aldehyde dehydrogenase family protein [Halobacterium litoreum]|uniref:Aldehyde dehydrogenase family protein n=1 Tax=Halobacterium litoreum TaxID=2039234 RepID=A0ABD5NGP0_9EURY|nr:aldehyde dehydrogenase family protein [Halobacterium litoreum]UHH13121.1 aldehyde dehydrogenase family protein [Halobacterium litoreum]